MVKTKVVRKNSKWRHSDAKGLFMSFLLNPQNEHLKIDAYLLNLVSHDFWRQIVTLFPSDKSFK